MLINESDIVSVNRKDLITHPKNPRKGNVDLIIESIEENGFYGALIVQKSTGYILAGNHRFVAGTEIGMEEFPVIFVDVDDRKALKILLADNKTSDDGTYDNSILFEVLQEFSIDDNLLGTGYSLEDFEKIKLDDTNLEPILNEIDFNFYRQLVVDFSDNDSEFEKLFNELEARGFKCKILTS